MLESKSTKFQENLNEEMNIKWSKYLAEEEV